MTTTPTTVHIIKGVPQETELAALITALQVLTWSTAAATPHLPTHPRKTPWTRPRRRSGPAWVRALD